MNDDTIYHYLGREAKWVARCGFHHVESGNERFTDNDAAGLIEFVWEFCEASCVAVNATVPQKKAGSGSAPLGSARLRPDHHAQGRWMANPRAAN